MGWPKGKKRGDRPEADRKKIAAGKQGIPPSPEHREALKQGQKRRRDREREEREKQ